MRITLDYYNFDFIAAIFRPMHDFSRPMPTPEYDAT